MTQENFAVTAELNRLGTKVQLNQVTCQLSYVTHVSGDENEPNNRPTINSYFCNHYLAN